MLTTILDFLGVPAGIKVRTPREKGNSRDRIKGLYYIISFHIETQLKYRRAFYFPLIGMTIPLKMRALFLLIWRG